MIYQKYYLSLIFRPETKVKATETWRLIGHQSDNPRMRIAEMKAIENAKNKKKKSSKTSAEKTDAENTAEEPAPHEYPVNVNQQVNKTDN